MGDASRALMVQIEAAFNDKAELERLQDEVAKADLDEADRRVVENTILYYLGDIDREAAVATGRPNLIPD